MGLTRIALARPIFILMLMLAALLVGTISYNSMRKELNPDVNFGVVTVSTVYPGAGPDDINQLVSRRIEEAVSGVNGIREITSTSQEGISVVVAQIELGMNVDTAANDIRSRVDAITNELPREVLKPQVTKFDNSAQPVLTLAIASEKLTSAELRTLVDDRIRDQFAQIPGVAAATVNGGDVREVQVRVKKDKLLAYGIGILDVQRAVAASTVNAPSGRIVSGPQEYTVRVKNDFEKPEDILDTVISIQDPNRMGAKASTVRLRDVADVVDAVQERTSYARLNGRDTISLSLSKATDGNAIEIEQAADQVIAGALEQYKDLGLTIRKTMNQATQIRHSLDDLKLALYFGIFLVAVIVYVFLHNLRGTIIVAIAIPTSIFATFVVMKLFGFTINNMSMLSLSLAVGVLVDDAIVVLENIYRHLRLGEDPREAAINGRSEIGLAAIAITLADVVVFLPIAFMGGIVGQFFKPLALGFVIATLFSLFVSFTVTPLLASRWYRAGEDWEHPKGRFAVWFERAFGRLSRGYGRALEWALNHRWFVFLIGNISLLSIFTFIAGSSVPALPPIGATGAEADPSKYGIPGALRMGMPLLMAAAVVGAIVMLVNSIRWGKLVPRFLLFGFLFGLIFPVSAIVGHRYAVWKQDQVFKGGFIPESDAGIVTASIELPPGTSLEETERVVAEVEKVFMADPDMKYVLSNVGQQGIGNFSGSSSGSNFAQVTGTLYEKGALLDRLPWKKHEERLRFGRSDQSVAADLTLKVGRIPGAKVKVSASGGFGFGSAVQLSFTSEDRKLLVQTAQKVRDGLASGVVEGVVNADLSSKPGKPELRVIPNRLALADQGIDAASAGAAIRTAYQGDDTTKMRVNGREYDVRVMLDPEDRNNPNMLSQVPLRFVQGQPVYLSQVASIDTAPGIDRITRRNRAEEVVVTADILPGYANGSVNLKIQEWLTKEKIIPEGVKQSALGQFQAMMREMQYMFGALILGLVLVYMLLASLYNNLLYPWIVQLAQPQAMVGALIALMLTDKSLNLVGFIGIVTLIGLVGKNAILLVDYTNTLRARGRSRHDAIVEAGPTRLRPIMMTTLALILGMLPVALAIGRGSEFRDTIGITIIGGITLSTLMTLFVIPASYTIFDDMSSVFSRGRRRRHAAPSADVPPAIEEDPHEPAGIR